MSQAPLKLKNIGTDGNCCFRALSYAITGDEEQHKEIKNIINEHACKQNLAKTDHMEKLGVWGGTTEFLTATNLLRCQIFVWGKYGNRFIWHRYGLEEDWPIILLCHTNGNHFDFVLNFQED